jgi:hypothetical protein
MKETGIAASKSDYTVSIPSGTYDSERNRILTLIGKEGLKLEKLEHQEATLEDVFMHHIQEVTDDIS